MVLKISNLPTSLFVAFSILLFACDRKEPAKTINYLPYYHLCNAADKSIYLEKYDTALIHLETAFELVPFVHSDNYLKAAKCSFFTQQFKKGSTYLEKAILGGRDPKYFLEKLDEQILNINEVADVIRQKDSLLNLSKNKFDTVYARKIDSLVYLDQVVVRDAEDKGHDFKFPDSLLAMNKSKLDQLIFKELTALIEQYGFPSESLVGPQANGTVGIIFHHQVRLPENEVYINVLEDALLQGAYDPSSFAWMYDQSLLFKGKDPKFYFAVPIPPNINEDWIKKVDAARYQYGIKPFESLKIWEEDGATWSKILW